MSTTVRRTIAIWLPIAFVSTLFALLVYAAVQQSYRGGANDPQLQMAEDAAAQLGGDTTTPAELTSGPTVNLATSLAPYTIVYDAQGKVLASTGMLSGHAPTPPSGVLQEARDHGSNSITWQPAAGVRSAIVVMPYGDATSGGTVLVGRSLRSVEDREGFLLLMAAVAWIGALVGGLVVAFVAARLWGSSDPGSGAAATQRQLAA